MKKIALLLACLVVCLLAILLAYAADRPQFPSGYATITGADGVKHQFAIEIATSETQQEYGLMFVRHLPADHGMLFEFYPPQVVHFWMKNTKIPLDMVFIGPDGHIANIASDAVPESEDVIASSGLVRQVLEINGGLAAKLGLKTGDTVAVLVPCLRC